jgi:hypothetical protein
VLDFGVTEEANRRLVGLTPELSLGEGEGIVESDRRVEVLRERLQVTLGLPTDRERRDGSKFHLFSLIHDILHDRASGGLLLRGSLANDDPRNPARHSEEREVRPAEGGWLTVTICTRGSAYATGWPYCGACCW